MTQPNESGAEVREAEMAACTVARFWSHVRVGGRLECWEWQAGLRCGGYGVFVLRHGKTLPSHRFIWSEIHGEIPKGLNICHKCDNPRCVNPRHLFIGTQYDNIQDQIRKGRMVRGEQHGRAKLRAAQVLEIRALSNSGVTFAEIGRRFSIAWQHAQNIVNRRIWRHV